MKSRYIFLAIFIATSTLTLVSMSDCYAQPRQRTKIQTDSIAKQPDIRVFQNVPLWRIENGKMMVPTVVEPAPLMIPYIQATQAVGPTGWLVATPEIIALTNLADCRYVHISLTQLSADPRNISIVLSGVNGKYDHLFLSGAAGGDVVSGAFPCPDCCNTNLDSPSPSATTYFASTPYNAATPNDHSARTTLIKKTTIASTSAVSSANLLIDRYIGSHPAEIRGWLIRKDELVDMIGAWPYVHFIRGKNGTNETLIIVATDAAYNHKYLSEDNRVDCVLESIYPCPQCFDTYSRPQSKYRVNDRLEDRLVRP